MICALWGVDLKFPPVTRASPHPCLAASVPRPVALASLAPRPPRRICSQPSAPAIPNARSCSPCSFLLISARLRISAHLRISRIPRHACLAPRFPGHGKPSTKNRFHDNRSGCVEHCGKVCRTLQKPLSFHHLPDPPLTRAPRRGMLCWGSAGRRPREKL